MSITNGDGAPRSVPDGPKVAGCGPITVSLLLVTLAVLTSITLVVFGLGDARLVVTSLLAAAGWLLGVVAVMAEMDQ